jgi:hypothetical protein
LDYFFLFQCLIVNTIVVTQRNCFFFFRRQNTNITRQYSIHSIWQRNMRLAKIARGQSADEKIAVETEQNRSSAQQSRLYCCIEIDSSRKRHHHHVG